MPANIVIIEDNEDTNILLQNLIRKIKHTPESYFTAEEFLQKGLTSSGKIYLVDLVLPEMQGTELIKRIRAFDKFAAIFMISGNSDEDSVTSGLNAGADDYISKPFNVYHFEMKILNAFVKLKGISKIDINKGIKLFDDITSIAVQGKFVSFTQMEYSIMKVLHNKSGVFVSRDEIVSEVKGALNERGLDVHIHALRKKISFPNVEIQTSRGQGYRFFQS